MQLDQTCPGNAPAAAARRRFARPSAWHGAAALLVLAALASFFPLRFSATAGLAFETGMQPPAVAVRGVAQLLASREMAQEVVRRLGPQDAARLAARIGFAAPAEGDAARAALRIMEGLEVVPGNGGRDLALTLSAPTPALAARAADAYVAAFLALDAAARDGSAALPPIRQSAPGVAAPLPDAPRPLALGLLAAAALVLMLARRHARRPEAAQGPVDGASLPVELQPNHRIAWLGTPGAGIDETEAAARLATLAGPPGTACHLLILTSEALPEASAGCAIALARRLCDEARVALVALDGKAEALRALVDDPRAPGMSEMLFGVAGFGETIHRDTKSRAHVIPPGRDALTVAAAVGADRLLLVLEALRRTYDYVVVAAPDLTAAQGAERLAGLEPLMVCLTPDDAPETAAVESFDALAEQHFRRVVMVRFAAPGAPEALPAPSLDAESIAAEWALLRGAA